VPDERQRRNVAGVQRALKESDSGAERVLPSATTPPATTQGSEDGSRLPAWEPVSEVSPPRIPNWEPSATAAEQDGRGRAYGGEPSFVPGISHPRAAELEDTRRPSRTVIIVAAVACLLIVILAATAIYASLHHSTTAATVAPPTTASHVVSPAASARIHQATANVLTATTKAQHQLVTLPGFPTPPKTARVINPYISSLQNYRDFLSNLTVPAAAQGAKRTATEEINQDLRFLATINGLEPLQLGTWLVQFGANTVDVQTALSTFEEVLHVPTT
jgi:hypothetical protein